MANSSKNNSNPTQFCLVGDVCYSGQFTPKVDRLTPVLRETMEGCANAGTDQLRNFLDYEEAIDNDGKIVPGHISEGILDCIGKEGNDMYDRAEAGELGIGELVSAVYDDLMKGNEVEIDMEGGGMLKLQVVTPAEPEQEPETPKEPEGGKKFRITYRSEIYITAANEEEAREKFEALDLTSKEGNSRFVEEVSFEPQD